MKKKAPGNQEEVQDLAPRGMEGKEEDSRPPPSYRHGANKLKWERKVPGERRNEVKLSDQRSELPGKEV